MIDANCITINPEEVNRLREENAGLRDQRNELQFLYDGQAAMLCKIRRVCSGEDQVADDDTERLAWIADYIDNGPEGDEPMDDATRYALGSM